MIWGRGGLGTGFIREKVTYRLIKHVHAICSLCMPSIIVFKLRAFPCGTLHIFLSLFWVFINVRRSKLNYKVPQERIDPDCITRIARRVSVFANRLVVISLAYP